MAVEWCADTLVAKRFGVKPTRNANAPSLRERREERERREREREREEKREKRREEIERERERERDEHAIESEEKLDDLGLILV